jgi:hypothetical protein
LARSSARCAEGDLAEELPAAVAQRLDGSVGAVDFQPLDVLREIFDAIRAQVHAEIYCVATSSS